MEQTTVLDHAPRGMRTFMIIWLGQLISMIGSGLTSFAFGVWIYDQTGRATPFALTVLFGTLPGVLLAPLAGVVADRFNRRWIMILADTGAALVTLFAVSMLSFSPTGLQVWHIYLIALVGSTFGAFQQPAYMSSVTMLVPKKHFGRASGLTQTGYAVSQLVSPLLAGVLYTLIGLKWIIIIDFVTYFFAVGALMAVHIPQPEMSGAGREGRGSMLKEVSFGWVYLKARPALLVMLFYYALVNFLLSLCTPLVTPLVLAFSGAAVLGIIQTVNGAGLLAGSLIMSAWGGTKRKMTGVYVFIALFSLGFFLMGLQSSAVLIGLGMFVLMFSLPIAAGSSQVIWMSKVEPDIQGRVFSIRAMLAHAIMPLAYLISGPLADHVFGPLMSEGGALAGTVAGQVLGVGMERGIGLMLMLSGVLLLVVTAGAYAYRPLRLVEDLLPDVVPDIPEETAVEAQPQEAGEPVTSPA